MTWIPKAVDVSKASDGAFASKAAEARSGRREFTKTIAGWALLSAALGLGFQAESAAAADKQVIVYSSEEMIEFMARKFEEKHPDIRVRVVLGSSGELSARIIAEAARPRGDVFWGGGSIELAHPQLFRPVKDLNTADIGPQFPRYELKVPIQVYAGIYIVNHELLKGAPPPKTWQELADPKWKGKFYFGNPISSSAAFSTMLGWYQIGGWDLVKKIAANAVITQGSADPVRAAGNGEATVGTGVERVSYQWTDGNRVTAVYPEDGVVMMYGDMYIMKGAPNEEAAKTFVNYMLSAEAQTAMSKEFKGARPTNANGKVPEGLVETAKLKLIELPADVATNRQPWVDKWKEIITSVR